MKVQTTSYGARDLMPKEYVDAVALRRPTNLVPALTRSTANSNTNGGVGGLVQNAGVGSYALASVLYAAEGTKTIRLRYWNGYTKAGTAPNEASAPNAVTIRARIMYPAGPWNQQSGSTAWASGAVYNAGSTVTYSSRYFVAIKLTTAGTAPTSALGTEWIEGFMYDVHWTGEDANRRVSVAAGAEIESDPITITGGIHWAYGPYVGIIFTIETGANTNYWVPGDVSGAGVDFVVNYATTGAIPAVGAATNPVDNGITTQTNAAAGTALPLPTVVLGERATVPSIALLGDSLSLGTGDSRVIEQPGWPATAAENYHWLKLALGGGQLTHVTDGGVRERALQYADAVIITTGVNEIQAGKTLATIQTELIAKWQRLRDQGVRIWAATNLPFTSSTDAWATTTNQSAPGSPSGAWGASGIWWNLNRWLRDGAPITYFGQAYRAGQHAAHPLAGVLDPGAAVTDPATGWKWSAGLTADGAHPNGTAVALIAAAVGGVMETVAYGYRLAPPSEQSLNHLDAVTVQPAAASGTFVPTGGTVYACKFLHRGGTIARLHTYVTSAGSGLTAAQNLMAVYTLDGTRLGVTADQTTAWGSTGDKIASVTSFYAPAGELFLAWLSVGTTRPTFAASPSSPALNLNVPAPGSRACSVATGQTSLPSTLSFATQTLLTQVLLGGVS